MASIELGAGGCRNVCIICVRGYICWFMHDFDLEWTKNKIINQVIGFRNEKHQLEFCMVLHIFFIIKGAHTLFDNRFHYKSAYTGCSKSNYCNIFSSNWFFVNNRYSNRKNSRGKKVPLTNSQSNESIYNMP